MGSTVPGELLDVHVLILLVASFEAALLSFLRVYSSLRPNWLVFQIKMLNKAERFEVLRMIRFWCKIGFLPMEVNLSTWELLPHAKKRTTWKCYFLFLLYAMNGLYKLIALVYWLKVGVPIHEAVIHAVLAVVPTVYCYWYYFLYFKNPRLFGMYLKMTLTGNDGMCQQRFHHSHILIIFR